MLISAHGTFAALTGRCISLEIQLIFEIEGVNIGSDKCRILILSMNSYDIIYLLSHKLNICNPDCHVETALDLIAE